MGEGSRAAGRVGSDFLSAIAGRVWSGQGFAGSVGSGPRKVTRGQLCADAATMLQLDCAEPEPVRFRADHRFLFFIRSNTTRFVLFLGKLVNPLIIRFDTEHHTDRFK